MSHVTYESCQTHLPHLQCHMNESCHIWMSRVTCERAMSQYESVMSHIWMSHVTYRWAMSHIRLSHVAHMNESCHTWIIVNTPPAPPAHLMHHLHGSCHTHEYAMPHTWMRHATYHVSHTAPISSTTGSPAREGSAANVSCMDETFHICGGYS